MLFIDSSNNLLSYKNSSGIVSPVDTSITGPTGVQGAAGPTGPQGDSFTGPTGSGACFEDVTDPVLAGQSVVRQEGVNCPIGSNYVFGSTSTEDTGSAGDRRVLFIKDDTINIGRGCFRAGRVTGSEWDAANRGDDSVAFGFDNTSSGDQSGVLSGQGSSCGADSAVICGGLNSCIDGTAVRSFIGGGNNHTCSANECAVVGGLNNESSGNRAFVGAGNGNNADGIDCVVCGGAGNYAGATQSFVGGGNNNTASANESVVVGGCGNIADTAQCCVVAGDSNRASAQQCGIVCGINNDIGVLEANGVNSCIGGGSGNRIGNDTSFIGAGSGNLLTGTGDLSAIVAGVTNEASNTRSIIGAGASNLIDGNGPQCIIGAGTTNLVRGSEDAGILAGRNNAITGASCARCVIVGGDNNRIEGPSTDAFIGAGENNTIDGICAAVCAGNSCTASGPRSFVGAGQNNHAFGNDSGIVSGCGNRALGNSSLVGGDNASDGGFDHCLVWNGDTASGSLTATGAGQILMRAPEGTRIQSNNAGTSGVILTPGAGSWASISDRNMKENIVPLNHGETVDKLRDLEIYRYNYKSQDPSVICRGPVAQEWYEKFPTNKADTVIETMDIHGISLSAIKNLISEVDDLRRRVEYLESNIARS